MPDKGLFQSHCKNKTRRTAPHDENVEFAQRRIRKSAQPSDTNAMTLEPSYPGTPQLAASSSAIEHVLLAFDYGEIRIGVAVGNTITRRARALTIFPNTSVAVRFAHILSLIQEWQPAQLIVGLPCHPDGQPHAMTKQAKRFGNQLQGRFGLPVVWVDERYSSVEAHASSTKNIDKIIDAEAACIILQQFFDTEGTVVTPSTTLR